jgi:hypothetical protein
MGSRIILFWKDETEISRDETAALAFGVQLQMCEVRRHHPPTLKEEKLVIEATSKMPFAND